jgi:hypothetical protein
MPSKDWLEKLSDSLRPETPSSEWKNCAVIAKALGRSESSAKALSIKMVQSGEWEERKFRVKDSRGSIVLRNYYRPVSSARSARK